MSCSYRQSESKCFPNPDPAFIPGRQAPALVFIPLAQCKLKSCSSSKPLAKQHPAQSLCLGSYRRGCCLLPKAAPSHMAEQSHITGTGRAPLNFVIYWQGFHYSKTCSLSCCLSLCTASFLQIFCLEVSRWDNFDLKDQVVILIPGWSLNRSWLQLLHPAHHSWWKETILMLKLPRMRLYVTGHAKETATDGLEN